MLAKFHHTKTEQNKPHRIITKSNLGTNHRHLENFEKTEIVKIYFLNVHIWSDHARARPMWARAHLGTYKAKQW